MKRILHFKNITFKSSYNWFRIDIHQQLRPLTANYLAMFKVTSTIPVTRVSMVGGWIWPTIFFSQNVQCAVSVWRRRQTVINHAWGRMQKEERKNQIIEIHKIHTSSLDLFHSKWCWIIANQLMIGHNWSFPLRCLESYNIYSITLSISPSSARKASLFFRRPPTRQEGPSRKPSDVRPPARRDTSLRGRCPSCPVGRTQLPLSHKQTSSDPTRRFRQFYDWGNLNGLGNMTQVRLTPQASRLEEQHAQ